MNVPSVDEAARHWAREQLLRIEEHFSADGLTMIGPIMYGLEHQARQIVESRQEKRPSLFVIVDTPGGIVEVVERIVRVLRQHYQEVRFAVPDRAMSAGTILVMSGDAILMDYHSCLGPIDPQVQRDGKLVPALSYLVQYERLIERSNAGLLSTAEVVLLQKMDLAELHQFELAKELSISLLKNWLATYKFKDWKITESGKTPVSREMKEARAGQIADALSDHQRWHTHGRGIDLRTLQDELKLKIDDLGADSSGQRLVWDYFWFLRDHMRRYGFESFLHSPEYF